jgi:hypothetical protein
MRDTHMKKSFLIGLIVILCILFLLAAACLRPIMPGTYFQIVYPGPDAVVPTEFSVLGVAAKWSFGLEVSPLLFLGSPKSHVALPPSFVELSVDGVPYARSEGGNHHVFRVAAAPGDHTLRLTTPYGKTELVVHVTDDPPVVFAPFDEAGAYADSVDRLKSALYDYLQDAPPPVPREDGSFTRQRIYLAGDGAFIVSETMKDQYLAACEVNYVAPIGTGVTAADIEAAQPVFTWDAAALERPAKLATMVGAGDRLYLAVIDDTELTVFMLFPDGRAERQGYPLSGIAPELPESLQETTFSYILTSADRGTLFISLDTYHASGTPGHFDILVRDGVAETVDLGGKNVCGIGPHGDLITFYPAPYVGPFDVGFVEDAVKTSGYLPLPEVGDTFSFTGGSVHNTRDFNPEHPQFEIAPVVPCVGCTAAYVPPYSGIAGDVKFGPDVLKTTLGAHEEYFIMTR